MSIQKYQQATPINHFESIAEKLALTNYFIDEDGLLDAKVLVARGFAKIMMGHELGLSPMFSMQHVNIIRGKMTLDSGGVAALIAASEKYDYKVKSLSDTACEIEFLRGDESLGLVNWTIEDAKKAGLVKSGGAWEKFPKDLLFARSITAGARRYTPDIFGGSVYTKEELTESEPEPQEVNAEYSIEEEPYTDKERKNFHALGSMVYGDDWDTKRHELVSYITKGRTSSSNDLSRAEMVKLITGMQAKQNESIPETGIS